MPNTYCDEIKDNQKKKQNEKLAFDNQLLKGQIYQVIKKAQLSSTQSKTTEKQFSSAQIQLEALTYYLQAQIRGCDNLSQFLKQKQNSIVSYNSYVNDNFIPISQFFEVLQYKSDNFYEIALQTYDIADYEQPFKQMLVNQFVQSYSKDRRVESINFQTDLFYQTNSKTFRIIKAFEVVAKFETFWQISSVLETRLTKKSQNWNCVQEGLQKLYESLNYRKKENEDRKMMKRKSNPVFGVQSNKIFSNLPQFKLFSPQQTFKISKNEEEAQVSENYAEFLLIIIKYKYRSIRELTMKVYYYYVQMSRQEQYLARSQFKAREEALRKAKMPEQSEFRTGNQSRQPPFSKYNDLEKSLADCISSFRQKLKYYEREINELLNLNKLVTLLDRTRQPHQKQSMSKTSEFWQKKKLRFCEAKVDVYNEITSLCNSLIADVANAEVLTRKLICVQTQLPITFLLNEEEVEKLREIAAFYLERLSLDSTEMTEIRKLLQKNQQIQISSREGRIAQYFFNQCSDTSLIVCYMLGRYQKLCKSRRDWNWQQEIKQGFQHMNLYNYTLLCQRFTLGISRKSREFDLDYFCQKQSIPLNDSIEMKKIKFFWQTFFRNNLLKRIYSNGTLSFQQLNHISHHQSFTIRILYNKFHFKEEIEQKVTYVIHLCQFYSEIIAELSSPSNQSLSHVFNSTRFLILFFVTLFCFLSLKKIENQILQKSGELYFHLFKQYQKKNKKYNECFSRMKSTFLLITQNKISKYLEQIQKNKERSTWSINTKKIYILFQQNSQMEQIYDRFKDVELQSIVYDSELTQKIYLNTLKLVIKQYSSKQAMEKALNKIVQTSLEKYPEIKQKDFQIKTLDFLIKPSNKLQRQVAFQPIFRKFLIPYIQTMKMLGMICCLPYYSYENQLQNYKRKHFKKQALSPQEKKFACFDQFYIYQRSRVNCDSMKNIYGELDNQQLLIKYLPLINQFLDFILDKDVQKKVSTLKDVSNRKGWKKIFKYPKPLHEDRFALFQLSEMQEFYLQIFSPKGEATISNRMDVQRNILQNFIDFGKALQSKGVEFFQQTTISIAKSSIPKIFELS